MSKELNEYELPDLSYFEDKTILITGASGLIGSQLINILSSTNYSFVCDCIINSKLEKWLDAVTKNDKRFEYCEIDLASWKDYDFSPRNYYDVIIHFATYGQPNIVFDKRNPQNQLKTIELNTTATIKLFKLLKPNGKFLFMSSSEVYQGLEGIHKEEDIGTTTTTHSRSCYIEAKRCGEAVCNIYKEGGCNVKIVRLCLAYGAGVKRTDKRVLNKFIFEALTENKISLLDDGSAMRTYCYVTDVINMSLNILLHGKSFIYNVGGIERTTIKQIALNVGNVLKVPVVMPKDNDNKVTGASIETRLDISKYLKEFKKENGMHKNFVPFNIGLKKTIEWCKFLIATEKKKE